MSFRDGQIEKFHVQLHSEATEWKHQQKIRYPYRFGGSQKAFSTRKYINGGKSFSYQVKEQVVFSNSRLHTCGPYAGFICSYVGSREFPASRLFTFQEGCTVLQHLYRALICPTSLWRRNVLERYSI